MDFRYCWEDFTPGRVFEHGERRRRAGHQGKPE
mgnify:CR=1 FL=1